MYYKNESELQNQAIGLFLEGYNITKIAKMLHLSRQYVSKLIRDDERVIAKKNTTIVKINKISTRKEKKISIPLYLFSQIGISSNDYKEDEYVQITANKERGELIIKKYEK